MKSNVKLNGADYLLLLLYLDNKKPIKGAIRITKMMYLFEKEIQPLLKNSGIDSENLPNFIAYNFGPFSKDLYEQIDFFTNIKFIKTKDIKAEEMGEVDDWRGEWFDGVDDPVNMGYAMDDSKYMCYTIDSLGEKYVENKIRPSLTSGQIKLLDDFKKKIVKTTAKDILRYVYTKYPESAENSLIRKDILGEDDEN
jgi:hypothetical protein